MVAYFSNGSEGVSYMESYCFECKHWKKRKGEEELGMGCPVWDVQSCHQPYSEEKEIAKAKQDILDMLIPREDMSNKQCRMFDKKKIAEKDKYRNTVTVKFMDVKK